MRDNTSRYHRSEVSTLAAPDGQTVSYLRRRFLPQGQAMPQMLEATVEQGDRLDLITAKTLGDPTQFWRVADANNTMNPLELTDTPGKILRVPVPTLTG